MAAELLALKSIHLTFGGTPLLEGADLSVREGDRICLVGRNGSGKSTLMRIAAGLAEPDSGQRFVHPSARVRYLPQEADFTGFATALDYVAAGLDAIEVFHSKHDQAAVARYMGLAAGHGLLVTGGSDFHGTAHGPAAPGAVALPPEHFNRLLARARPR